MGYNTLFVHRKVTFSLSYNSMSFCFLFRFVLFFSFCCCCFLFCCWFFFRVTFSHVATFIHRSVVFRHINKNLSKLPLFSLYLNWQIRFKHAMRRYISTMLYLHFIQFNTRGLRMLKLNFANKICASIAESKMRDRNSYTQRNRMIENEMK